MASHLKKLLRRTGRRQKEPYSFASSWRKQKKEMLGKDEFKIYPLHEEKSRRKKLLEAEFLQSNLWLGFQTLNSINVFWKKLDYSFISSCSHHRLYMLGCAGDHSYLFSCKCYHSTLEQKSLLFLIFSSLFHSFCQTLEIALKIVCSSIQKWINVASPPENALFGPYFSFYHEIFPSSCMGTSHVTIKRSREVTWSYCLEEWDPSDPQWKLKVSRDFARVSLSHCIFCLLFHTLL